MGAFCALFYFLWMFVLPHMIAQRRLFVGLFGFGKEDIVYYDYG